MKKINDNNLEVIGRALKVATVLGLENFVMDAESLRGSNPTLGTLMIAPTEDLDTDLPPFGIGRVGLFKNRLAMFMGNDFELSYTLSKDGTFISEFEMKKGRTKSSFKCADPVKIKAGKRVNDPIAYSFLCKPSDLEIISKSISSLRSSDSAGAELTLMTDQDGGVSFSLSDTDGDTIKHELDDKVALHEDGLPLLSRRYDSKTFQPILRAGMGDKTDTDITVSITKRGIIVIPIVKIPVYIFPRH